MTPDSFSDGGRFAEPSRAVARAHEMARQGADVIDIGGESSRPAGATYGAGAPRVRVAEEIERVVPVVEELSRALDLPLSVDTVKPEVAARAIEAGARIVNDVSCGRCEELLRVVAEGRAELVLMHNRNRGEVDERNTRYDDVVSDVLAELEGALARAEAAGIARARLWIDPGIGFAKTPAQSLELLARTGALVGRGPRVLVGASRKSFIAHAAPRPDGSRPGPAEREGGTAAAVSAAVMAGASAVRVHDVGFMHQVVRMAEALRAAGGAGRGA